MRSRLGGQQVVSYHGIADLVLGIAHQLQRIAVAIEVAR